MAMRILRASWNIRSSDHSGLIRVRLLAKLLCSLRKRIDMNDVWKSRVHTIQNLTFSKIVFPFFLDQRLGLLYWYEPRRLRSLTLAPGRYICFFHFCVQKRILSLKYTSFGKKKLIFDWFLAIKCMCFRHFLKILYWKRRIYVLKLYFCDTVSSR